MIHSRPASRLLALFPKLRFSVFLGAIAGLSVLISNCTASPPVTLTLMVPNLEAASWSSIVAEFESINSDIRMKLEAGPTDIERFRQMTADALKKGKYDLAYLDIIWAPEFGAKGLLMDLSDKISEEELSDFLPNDVAGGRYQGKLYRLPFRSDLGLLYYRKDLLEQTGEPAPNTFDQLIQMSEKLQKQEAAPWGYLWQGGQSESLAAMFVEVLHGYGGFWIDSETGKVGLAEPAALQAVEFLRSTLDRGISPPNVMRYKEEETRLLFESGQAVFLRSWPYVWEVVNAADSPIRGKIGIQSMIHAPGKTSSPCQGGWGFGVAANTKHPEQTWRAIAFFTSAAAQRQFTLETGYVPSRRSLLVDPEIVTKFNYYPKLLEMADNSVLRPRICQYAKASQILQRHLKIALQESSRSEAEKVMQDAAQETYQLLTQEKC